MMELFAAGTQHSHFQWPYLFALALGALGMFLLLPSPRGKASLGGSLCCIGSIGWLAYLGLAPQSLLPETGLFCFFSLMALVGAVLLATLTNPARAAICFALVVICVGGLMLLLAAPFLMAANIIVYAGAIVVTFLFVLMLAQQEGPSDADHRSREPALACLTGLALSASLLLLLQRDHDVTARSATPEGSRDALVEAKASIGAPVAWHRAKEEVALRRDEYGRPTSPRENTAFLGQNLYTSQLFPVELAGILLLVATAGAILIAQKRTLAEVSR